MFRHILVATDFSIPSLAAVWSARELARRLGSRLTLLHVFAPGASHSVSNEALADVRSSILDGIDAVEVASIAHARPDVAVCGHAVVIGADLIVAGRHGEHRLDERLIGTTTERVVRHAPCTTLVVHPTQREALTSLKHIGACSDFSEHSTPAVTAASSLAKVFDAWTTLVHVYDIVPPVSVIEDAANARADFGTMCKNALEKQRTTLLPDVPSSIEVIRDKSVVTALVNWATDRDVDLLMLGTHGRTGASRLLLGSVAERTVRHAPCAVMVVRPPPRQAGAMR